MVCNFPSILRSYQERGWKAAYLAPAHDPAMDEYASNDDRPIDVLFVGDTHGTIPRERRSWKRSQASETGTDSVLPSSFPVYTAGGVAVGLPCSRGQIPKA